MTDARLVHGIPCASLLASLRSLIDDGHCGSALHLASTASTNGVAMFEAAAGDTAALPRLIVADQQTGGRGRLGRSWYSDDGTLTMTMVYPLSALALADDAMPLIALAAGMAVADAIEMTVPPIQSRLKWPNDVYVGGGKVAGILVEGSSVLPRRVIVGVGINVATDLSQADADVAARARSLDIVGGRPLQRYEILPLVVRQLQQRLDQLAVDQQELLHQYRARCWLTGRTVRVLQNGRLLQGTVQGIQHDGALALRTPSGVVAIRSGELAL